MPPKPLVYNAELIGREDFTPELAAFRVRYDQPLGDGDKIFIPGQYVAIGLNNEEQPDLGSVRRSMSICSAPEEQGGAYEFYVRYVNHPESDNPLTHLLWKMKVGDRIYMTRKPVGMFTVESTVGAGDPRWRIYVAAGTGLAPFVSMVRSACLRDPKADLSRTILLHGASYPADLCYRSELEGYAESNGLRYFKTISRPKEAPDWSGDVGRVEDYFVPERLADLESRLGVESGHLQPSNAGILICGLTGTIGQTITRMASRGFAPFNRRIRKALEIPDERSMHIWWEQYDTTPVVDINDPEVVSALKSQLQSAWAQQP